MDDASSNPIASSLIRDGTVSGVLPSANSFAVHYPGYPSSAATAAETLGGLPEIAKVRSSDCSNLELRFRPDDPYCCPLVGDLHPCAALLLKISKSPGRLSAGVVARVNQAYHFEGMVDYQHVLAVHAVESSSRKRRHASDSEPNLDTDDIFNSDAEDVLMLVPRSFSLKNMPENIVLNPSANLFSKNIQKGIVEHRWEMEIEPCLAIAFNIDRIPTKINCEDNIPKDTDEWNCHIAVSKLFEERPIWPRRSLHERLLDDGLQVTDHLLRRLLFRTGYYFATGPFGRFWIRKGYDPRKDPESRIFQKVDFRMPPQLRNVVDWNACGKLKQKWKDLCQFQVFPSKTFVCLQLFELVDDFIQEEIRKPSKQSSCTCVSSPQHPAGWFSWPMLKTLRLRVRVRFISVFPGKGVEDLLKSTRELFERFKRMEALGRFWEPAQKHQQGNKDFGNTVELSCAESNGSENEREDEPINEELEEEEEEEEEELDGYESPPVAGEDDTFAFDDSSYQTVEGIPNNYLQELLCGFPFTSDSPAEQPNNNGSSQGANLSDGEYQILEQDDEEDDDD